MIYESVGRKQLFPGTFKHEVPGDRKFFSLLVFMKIIILKEKVA